MVLESITVSVNYADYLELTLASNAKYFSRSIVVTDTKDLLTPTVCARHKTVECLCTADFYANGAPFAKSAGLNAGLCRLALRGWVVAWDADIIISPSLALVFSRLQSLDASHIYGPRIKYHVQKSEAGSNLHSGGTACAGFFQLFNGPYVLENGIRYPNTSRDCSQDDVVFSQLFAGVTYIDATAFHLGPSMPDGIPNVNWQGRKSQPCPVTDAEITRLLA